MGTLAVPEVDDSDQQDTAADPTVPLALLYRNLRTSETGLTAREAQRRLVMVAAVLAAVSGTPVLAIAIGAVIVLNAAFAFIQETQAEKAVEALAGYLPSRASVLRDGRRVEVEASTLVPGASS
jgi:magnesium-transporting ATPase (P-type)